MTDFTRRPPSPSSSQSSLEVLFRLEDQGAPHAFPRVARTLFDYFQQYNVGDLCAPDYAARVRLAAEELHTHASAIEDLWLGIQATIPPLGWVDHTRDPGEDQSDSEESEDAFFQLPPIEVEDNIDDILADIRRAEEAHQDRLDQDLWAESQAQPAQLPEQAVRPRLPAIAAFAPEPARLPRSDHYIPEEEYEQPSDIPYISARDLDFYVKHWQSLRQEFDPKVLLTDDDDVTVLVTISHRERIRNLSRPLSNISEANQRPGEVLDFTNDPRALGVCEADLDILYSSFLDFPEGQYVQFSFARRSYIFMRPDEYTLARYAAEHRDVIRNQRAEGAYFLDETGSEISEREFENETNTFIEEDSRMDAAASFPHQ